MKLVPRALERLFLKPAGSGPTTSPAPSPPPPQHLDSWEALLVGARLHRARRRRLTPVPAAAVDDVLARARLLPESEAARRLPSDQGQTW